MRDARSDDDDGDVGEARVGLMNAKRKLKMVRRVKVVLERKVVRRGERDRERERDGEVRAVVDGVETMVSESSSSPCSTASVVVVV